MRLSEIIDALERKAPLRLQDDYDNAGLQVGVPSADISSVLVCLDVTEAVVDEAITRGCQLIVSHHPLLFHPLRQVGDATYQQRCVVKALAAHIAIYSAHTNLDNARGGVNYKIADLIGVRDLRWLSPKAGEDAGSGVVGELEKRMTDGDFVSMLQQTFAVKCMMHTELNGRIVKRVAICGGAGAFLLGDALKAEADCFVCGEFHYHDYFENEGMLLAELGHYQSERYTQDLLREILAAAAPELRIEMTAIDTNPIRYDGQ